MSDGDTPSSGGGPSRRMRAERGWTLYELHRFDEAAAIAQEGLSEAPDDEELLVLLGSAVLATGDTSRARKVAASAIAAGPDHAGAHILMSRVLRSIGRNGEAADAALQAVALDPWSPAAHVAASQAYTEMAAYRPNIERFRPAAVHHAMACIELDPFGPAGPICMANIALASEEWDIADQWGRRALELDPTCSSGHQALGLAAKGRGDRHAAGEHLVDAGRLDPRSSSTTEMLKQLVEGGPATLVLAIIWFVVVSMVMNVREEIGPWWTAAALAPLLGAFGGFIVWNRERRRNGLSARALEVLDADRSIGGSRPRTRFSRRQKRK